MISNCFYYGVYSPQGFYSLASKANFKAEKNYVIKCYSNAVKQELFNSIKSELSKRGCSYVDFCADERSLGIYSKDAGFRVLDGTYESVTYEAEIFSFDGADLTKSVKSCLLRRNEAVQRTQRFLTACRCINNDMLRLDYADMDIVKVNRYATRLWSSTGGVLNGNVGTEYKRFITCFTGDGVELNLEAFDIYCDNVAVICDRTGACAGKIVDRVRRYALSAGYDVISCLCPLNIENGAEHIIIPELKFGIFVCKHFHKADFEKSRKVYSGRFLVQSVGETRKRMDFSFKAYKRLMQEVFSSLAAVKKSDEELDRLVYNEQIIENQRAFFENLFTY